MTSPALSLIVPHRNHLHRLPRLLDSILAQSFKNLEVILVDDCSDAPCGPVVEAYLSRGLPLRLLASGERIHTLEARLRGIEAATGDIIGFADADDMLWGTDTLEANVHACVQSGADILHFRILISDEQGNFCSWAPISDPLAPSLHGAEILGAYCKADLWGISGLWNKFFWRELCIAMLKPARATSLTSYLEDGWLTLLLFSSAMHYRGSDIVGYAYAWQDQRDTADPLPTIALSALQRETAAFLRGQGRPQEFIDTICRQWEKPLRSHAGRLCMAINDLNGPEREAALEKLLRHPQRDELLRALVLAGGLNAKKLLGIYGMF